MICGAYCLWVILKAFNLKERKTESYIFLRVKHCTKIHYIITMVVRNKNTKWVAVGVW